MDILRVGDHLINVDKEGYICLTDMAKAKAGGTTAAIVINNWLKTQSAMGYLGLWEVDNNPHFKVQEFMYFKNSAGKKNFHPSIGSYVEKTGAIGIYVKAGKYGGTYAHKDIAYEFGTAISVEFRYLVFKEYQRLKEQEVNAGNLEWNLQRVMSKAQYHIQTAAVKDYKIPFRQIPLDKQSFAYSQEADLLNKALFGFTAKEWKAANVELAAKGKNVREFASANELTVLAALESLNAEMIKDNLDYKPRLERLTLVAKQQLEILSRYNIENTFRKTVEGELKPFFKEKENAKGMFPNQQKLLS